MPTSRTSKVFAGGHHLDQRFFCDLAADDADIDHDAAIGVVVGVEDERAQDIICGCFGRRNVDEDAARESL